VTSILWTAAIACAGALVGAGMALYTSSLLRGEPASSRMELRLATTDVAALTDAPDATGADERVTAPEQRVGVLQAERTGVGDGDGDEGESADPAHEDAASRRRHREAHERSLRAHAAEPVSQSWAASTSSTLRADLETQRDAIAAELLEVSCRSRSCIARLAWPTYDVARAHYGELLHAPSQVRCTREILLPEPPDPSRRYEATAFFDCTSE